MQWSIEQAAATKLFDHIIVSSDDSDVLQIAQDCKKLKVVPVERHKELATDTADMDDVLYDFFGRKKINVSISVYCHLHRHCVLQKISKRCSSL